mgnify:CR=1 FL=1
MNHRLRRLLAVFLLVALTVVFNELIFPGRDPLAVQAGIVFTVIQIGRKGTWKLRFDWSLLPPVSALAREITSAMAHCDSGRGAMTFEHLHGGVGMNLHTWALALCAAMGGGKTILTHNPWRWMDYTICADEEHPMLW